MRIMPNSRIIIAGKSGSGKTTLMKDLLRNYSSWIIYDCEGEFLGGYGVVVNSFDSLRNVLKQGAKRIVYNPTPKSEKEDIDEFNEVCRFVFTYVKNILFACDEIATYTKKMFIPYYLAQILKKGRKRGIGTLLACQRPQNVHNDIISQSNIRISFRLDTELDAKAMSKDMRLDFSELLNLQYFWFFLYNDKEIYRPLIKHRPV